ncbi:MAG: hypothetical protein PHY29_11685 [Syntrophales bacterium]|nr:hypothetical protein [Syntrophales bacterium]
MERHRKTARTSFFILSITGTLVVLIEVAMNLWRTSLCTSEGCKAVARYARYGDITFLIPGALVFLLLAILSRPGAARYAQYRDKLISTILCAAIASEGFLVGYQAFRVHAPCWFCLGVFALFALLGIIWLMSGHWEVITGFAGFSVVLALFYLILPVSNTGDSLGDHIDKNRLTLFYSSSCASCEEIENLCKECNIVLNKVDADQHFDLLEGMNIYEIPVLFVNDNETKRVLIGKTKITEFLSGNGDKNSATP